MTLGEGPSAGFSGGRKKGSFFQDDSAGCGAGAAGGGEGGTGADARGGLLKNWVKPPSAESDAPGDENPLAFDGPAEGGAGRGVSSDGRDGGVNEGVTLETKMRVKSPAPGSGGGCCDPLTTCVDACGGASLGGVAGGAGRVPRELNISVNSPGRAAPCPPAGPGGADRLGTVLAGEGGAGANGSAAFLALWLSDSKALRNIAVALRGSASSGSGPELGFLFVMGRRSCFRRAGLSGHPTDEDLSAGTPCGFIAKLTRTFRRRKERIGSTFKAAA